MKLLYSLLFIFLVSDFLFAFDTTRPANCPAVVLNPNMNPNPNVGSPQKQCTGETCNYLDSKKLWPNCFQKMEYKEEIYKPNDKVTLWYYTIITTSYMPVPPCETIPPPDGYDLIQGAMTSADCEYQASAPGLTTLNGSYTDLICYKDNCSQDDLYDLMGKSTTSSDSNSSTPDPCDPTSPDYDKADCDGDGIPNGDDPSPNGELDDGCPTYPGMTKIPLIKSICQGQGMAVIGQEVWDELVWDECSYSCYGVFLRFLSCEDIANTNPLVCQSPQILSFECSQQSGQKAVVTKNECITPDNPCDYAYNEVRKTCNLETHKIVGYAECEQSIVGDTANTSFLKCVPKNDDGIDIDDNQTDPSGDVLGGDSDYDDSNYSTVPDSDTELDANNKTNQLLADLGVDVRNAIKHNDKSLQQISNDIQDLGSKFDDGLGDISDKLDGIGDKLDEVNNNLSDGLFTDVDPFANVDFTDDGSSTFGDLENEAKNNLVLTEQWNLFNLKGLGHFSIPTYSFSAMGHTFTIFRPSMLDGIPIGDIRNLFMFFFAISGFITVFRTI